MDNLLSASLTELVELIRSRRLSSVELVTANIERIKEVNTTLNAVVQLCEERALAEAAACDAELAGGQHRGALHGIPFTLKDSHDAPRVRLLHNFVTAIEADRLIHLADVNFHRSSTARAGSDDKRTSW